MRRYGCYLFACGPLSGPLLKNSLASFGYIQPLGVEGDTHGGCYIYIYQREKLGTHGRVPKMIYQHIPPKYGLYNGFMGPYGVMFWDQLLGYFPKGTQHCPLNIPWESRSAINSMVFLKRPYCFTRDLLYQQFQGTIILMVFDLQGI